MQAYRFSFSWWRGAPPNNRLERTYRLPAGKGADRLGVERGARLGVLLAPPIQGFVVPAKRRMLQMLANPKKRTSITASLAHFRDLDPRWMVSIPPAQHFAMELERLLRHRGARDLCHVISENKELDGKTLPLGEALEGVVGQGMGTLISCVPGQLAFFEGEGPSDRCILARDAI